MSNINMTATTAATTCNDSIVSPLSLEEIVAMDSVKIRFGIKKSLQRSISFMRKSLSRSNSSDSLSGGGSMHSTTSTTESIATTSAFHESFTAAGNDISNFGTEQEGSIDGVHCDPILMPISCMKGSKSTSTSTSTQRNRRGTIDKRLRFRKMKDKTRMIEPYFEYASELWYTEKEKCEIFAKPGIVTKIDALNAERYIKTMIEARNIVYPPLTSIRTTSTSNSSSSNSSSNSNSNSNSTEIIDNSNLVKMELLPTKLYNEIIVGRECGFAGLEQYCSSLKNIRRSHIKNTIQVILTTYNECVEDYNLSKDEISNMVRSVSKSFTKADRYWASAMGNADYDSAVEVYKTI